MKTDTIFYRLFQSLPSIFFELLNQPPETANAYQFSSVEVKQLAFRIDIDRDDYCLQISQSQPQGD